MTTGSKFGKTSLTLLLNCTVLYRMFGGEGEVTLEKFLAAVNQLQFRGTSYLFRLPQPPVVRKSSVASPPADGGQSKKDSRDDDRVDRRLESSGSSGEICHTSVVILHSPCCVHLAINCAGELSRRTRRGKE